MVRHVIVFNSVAPEEQVRAIAAHGQRVLGAIPGVLEVRFGVAIGESPRYRYFFDIGFADESVIAYYRDHPAHVRFATEEFRPLAPERVTTDFRLV